MDGYARGVKRPRGFKKPKRPPRKMPRVAHVLKPSMVPYGTRGWSYNTIEKKVQDIAVATYQVNTTGSFTLLCIPVVGADMNARVGRKINIKSVYIRGYVGLQAALLSTADSEIPPQQARMIVFADMQPNAAAPAVTDLLNTATPASHLNLNNRDRFKILADKIFTFDSYINVSTATQSRAGVGVNCLRVKCYKKMNLETIFNAVNGGSIADITSGALYMFWIGSQAASDANAIVGTRVRYTDI